MKSIAAIFVKPNDIKRYEPPLLDTERDAWKGIHLNKIHAAENVTELAPLVCELVDDYIGVREIYANYKARGYAIEISDFLRHFFFVLRDVLFHKSHPQFEDNAENKLRRCVLQLLENFLEHEDFCCGPEIVALALCVVEVDNEDNVFIALNIAVSCFRCFCNANHNKHFLLLINLMYENMESAVATSLFVPADAARSTLRGVESFRILERCMSILQFDICTSLDNEFEPNSYFDLADAFGAFEPLGTLPLMEKVLTLTTGNVRRSSGDAALPQVAQIVHLHGLQLRTMSAFLQALKCNTEPALRRRCAGGIIQRLLMDGIIVMIRNFPSPDLPPEKYLSIRRQLFDLFAVVLYVVNSGTSACFLPQTYFLPHIDDWLSVSFMFGPAGGDFESPGIFRAHAHVTMSTVSIFMSKHLTTMQINTAMQIFSTILIDDRVASDRYLMASTIIDLIERTNDHICDPKRETHAEWQTEIAVALVYCLRCFLGSLKEAVGDLDRAKTDDALTSSLLNIVRAMHRCMYVCIDTGWKRLLKTKYFYEATIMGKGDIGKMDFNGYVSINVQLAPLMTASEMHWETLNEYANLLLRAFGTFKPMSRAEHERSVREVSERKQQEADVEKRAEEKRVKNAAKKKRLKENQAARRAVEAVDDELPPLTPLHAMPASLPAVAVAGLAQSTAAAQLSEPADDLLCPITLDLMVDPVVAADGITYERAAIEDWIDQARGGAGQAILSPKTGAELPHDMLIPNRSIQRLIANWKTKSSLHG